MGLDNQINEKKKKKTPGTNAYMLKLSSNDSQAVSTLGMISVGRH